MMIGDEIGYECDEFYKYIRHSSGSLSVPETCNIYTWFIYALI